MRKVVLYIASSLDGYIATNSGSVDWLFHDQDYGYKDFLAGIDTVMMGRRTYEQVLTFGDYPYKNIQSFVFSRTHTGERDENVKFISGDIEELVKVLKKGREKDIWLVGGSEIIQTFMDHDLIDEFIISIHPIILGEGIPLFRAPIPLTKLWFRHSHSFDTGLVQLTYDR